ncbi:DNA internalization-related competence protein ComEC/Rec2 [Thermodesulfovibrio yellowstonii]|uniref:DNA internalization-related competence protein ComEC/Rec2 n=1 Tax=Thermodesulfovibrio yellowstonii TaxID=28262 RepID=UPI0004130A23|nr:DNA internalization-related competence protein ComEC/Rec2 [Thermodesulfovibrio islandicus]
MPYILSSVFGILSGVIFIYFPILSIFLASLPIAVCLLKKKYSVAFVCLILSLVGVFYGNLREGKNFDNKETTLSFKGYVVSTKDNTHLVKTIEGKRLRVYSREKLEENRLYTVECKSVNEHKNPYVFSKQDFCYATKLFDEGKLNQGIFERVQNNINKKLKQKLNEPAASVMIAMTTGQRNEIPEEIKDDFQKTGLIHLLSISGAHFSLLFTVFFIVFRILTRFIPYKWLVLMTLYIKPSQLSIILCFPFLLFYYLLIEPNYPSTRAFIMALFFMLGVLTERKSIWIITVSLACLFILVIDPSSTKDLSFQLSFLATVAIGFATDIYKNFKNKIQNKVLSYLLLSLLISFSASLITAPIVIYKFHYLSLISPVANLTAGFVIGMFLFPLNVIFVFIYLITGIYPLPEIVNTIATFSFKLMHLLASFSFSSLSIPPIPLGSVILFYFGIFLSIFACYGLKGWFKKLSFMVSCLLIFSSVLTSLVLDNLQRNFIKITFLDVGQAESAVVETPEAVFLVDTGKTGFEAVQYLKAKGYRQLQALIITHEQKDHAGGFLNIIEKFNVKEIWDNGYIKYKIPMNVKHLERGDILKAGNCIFTLLHPYKGFYTSSLSNDSNELSLVFSLKCKTKTFLFTSDTGIEVLKSIPATYLKADIFKIPHHGSKRSFYKEFYETVLPQICIISVGKNNAYGHPHTEVLEYLKDKCKIYRTDIHGAIQIREKANGEIEVKTFEETKFKPYRELENLKKLFILW